MVHENVTDKQAQEMSYGNGEMLHEKTVGMKEVAVARGVRRLDRRMWKHVASVQTDWRGYKAYSLQMVPADNGM